MCLASFSQLGGYEDYPRDLANRYMYDFSLQNTQVRNIHAPACDCIVLSAFELAACCRTLVSHVRVKSHASAAAVLMHTRSDSVVEISRSRDLDLHQQKCHAVV